jgi:hypothetical protein
MHACHKSKKAACFGKVSLVLGLIELIAGIVIVVVAVTAVAAVVSSGSSYLDAISSVYKSSGSSASCLLKGTESACKAASSCKWTSISISGMCGSK